MESDKIDHADAKRRKQRDECSAKYLDFDCALEHELSRSGKRDIVKTISFALKIDTQFAAAAHLHRDWPISFFGRGKNQRARNHSRPTGEGLVFHSTLISTNGDGARAALFKEVRVCSRWREHRVVANHRSL